MRVLSKVVIVKLGAFWPGRTCACRAVAAASASPIAIVTLARRAMRIFHSPSRAPPPAPPRPLQDVAAEVGVLRHTGKLRLDIGSVNGERLSGAVLCVEADVLEQLLHHGLEPARADIL